jgi:hypothetical protein
MPSGPHGFRQAVCLRPPEPVGAEPLLHGTHLGRRRACGRPQRGSLRAHRQRSPWMIDLVIEFTDEMRATAFERYLKSGAPVSRLRSGISDDYVREEHLHVDPRCTRDATDRLSAGSGGPKRRGTRWRSGSTRPSGAEHSGTRWRWSPNPWRTFLVLTRNPKAEARGSRQTPRAQRSIAPPTQIDQIEPSGGVSGSFSRS